MIHISVDDSDMKKLQQQLSEVPHVLESSRFLNSIGIALAAQGKKNINEASADGTSSYALLRPSTIQQKTKLGYTAKPLTRTGGLIKSIGKEVQGKQLYLTAISYAKYHQFGTNKMPARAVFSVREENISTILKILTNALKTMFK